MEGGSANDYDYVSGDPINFNDVNGTCGEPAGFIGPHAPCEYKLVWRRQAGFAGDVMDHRTIRTNAIRSALEFIISIFCLLRTR